MTLVLLGVHIENTHIDALSKRANSRLYTLMQFKRAGLPQADPLIFYTTGVH
jgi:hypothetical protein